MNVYNMAVDSEIISFELTQFGNVVQEPRHFHLEFFVRKLICSTCETFKNRGCTVLSIFTLCNTYIVSVCKNINNVLILV